MAGRPKKRIDYAGWSVDIFSNDTKIDMLIDAQGWSGFGIYFYLCQMAFGDEGYFYRWSYALCATTARKMGGGIGSGTVKETVDYCLQIGLFDKGLFDRWGVLTSRGIQNSYVIVLRSKNRKGTQLIDEFFLLGDECKEELKSQGVIFVPINGSEIEVNSDSLKVNDDSLGENDHSLQQKESKVKDSKEKKKKDISSELKNSPSEPVIISLILSDKTLYPIFQKDIDEWKEIYPAVDIMQELRKMKGWCNDNPVRRKTKRGIRKFIGIWLSKQQDKGYMHNKHLDDPIPSFEIKMLEDNASKELSGDLDGLSDDELWKELGYE